MKDYLNNNWVAILGAVTGSVSLFIQIFRYLKEKPKIKIDILDNSLYYYDEFTITDSFSSPPVITFSKLNQAVTNLRIDNLSSNSTAIIKIELMNKKNDIYINQGCFKESFEPYYIENPVDLPVTISGYSSIKFSYFFKLNNIYNLDNLNLVITIQNGKRFKEKIKFKEIPHPND